MRDLYEEMFDFEGEIIELAYLIKMLEDDCNQAEADGNYEMVESLEIQIDELSDDLDQLEKHIIPDSYRNNTITKIEFSHNMFDFDDEFPF